MYKLICILLLVATGTWEQDFESAQIKADENNKYVLIYFSGSDWCANCLRFKKTILEDPTFNDFAADNLVMYNADFPRKKKNRLDEKKQATNNELASKYNQDNVFPKIVMIDREGNTISEFKDVAFEKGPAALIAHTKLKISK